MRYFLALLVLLASSHFCQAVQHIAGASGSADADRLAVQAALDDLISSDSSPASFTASAKGSVLKEAAAKRVQDPGDAPVRIQEKAAVAARVNDPGDAPVPLTNRAVREAGNRANDPGDAPVPLTNQAVKEAGNRANDPGDAPVPLTNQAVKEAGNRANDPGDSPIRQLEHAVQESGSARYRPAWLDAEDDKLQPDAIPSQASAPNPAGTPIYISKITYDTPGASSRPDDHSWGQWNEWLIINAMPGGQYGELEAVGGYGYGMAAPGYGMAGQYGDIAAVEQPQEISENGQRVSDAATGIYEDFSDAAARKLLQTVNVDIAAITGGKNVAVDVAAPFTNVAVRKTVPAPAQRKLLQQQTQEISENGEGMGDAATGIDEDFSDDAARKLLQTVNVDIAAITGGKKVAVDVAAPFTNVAVRKTVPAPAQRKLLQHQPQEISENGEDFSDDAARKLLQTVNVDIAAITGGKNVAVDVTAPFTNVAVRKTAPAPAQRKLQQNININAPPLTNSNNLAVDVTAPFTNVAVRKTVPAPAQRKLLQQQTQEISENGEGMGDAATGIDKDFSDDAARKLLQTVNVDIAAITGGKNVAVDVAAPFTNVAVRKTAPAQAQRKLQQNININAPPLTNSNNLAVDVTAPFTNVAVRKTVPAPAQRKLLQQQTQEISENGEGMGDAATGIDEDFSDDAARKLLQTVNVDIAAITGGKNVAVDVAAPFTNVAVRKTAPAPAQRKLQQQETQKISENGEDFSDEDLSDDAARKLLQTVNVDIAAITGGKNVAVDVAAPFTNVAVRKTVPAAPAQRKLQQQQPQEISENGEGMGDAATGIDEDFSDDAARKLLQTVNVDIAAITGGKNAAVDVAAPFTNVAVRKTVPAAPAQRKLQNNVHIQVTPVTGQVTVNGQSAVDVAVPFTTITIHKDLAAPQRLLLDDAQRMDPNAEESEAAESVETEKVGDVLEDRPSLAQPEEEPSSSAAPKTKTSSTKKSKKGSKKSSQQHKDSYKGEEENKNSHGYYSKVNSSATEAPVKAAINKVDTVGADTKGADPTGTDTKGADPVGASVTASAAVTTAAVATAAPADKDKKAESKDASVSVASTGGGIKPMGVKSFHFATAHGEGSEETPEGNMETPLSLKAASMAAASLTAQQQKPQAGADSKTAAAPVAAAAADNSKSSSADSNMAVAAVTAAGKAQGATGDVVEGQNTDAADLSAAAGVKAAKKKSNKASSSSSKQAKPSTTTSSSSSKQAEPSTTTSSSSSSSVGAVEPQREPKAAQPMFTKVTLTPKQIAEVHAMRAQMAKEGEDDREPSADRPLVAGGNSKEVPALPAVVDPANVAAISSSNIPKPRHRPATAISAAAEEEEEDDEDAEEEDEEEDEETSKDQQKDKKGASSDSNKAASAPVAGKQNSDAKSVAKAADAKDVAGTKLEDKKADKADKVDDKKVDSSELNKDDKKAENNSGKQEVKKADKLAEQKADKQVDDKVADAKKDVAQPEEQKVQPTDQEAPRDPFFNVISRPKSPLAGLFGAIRPASVEPRQSGRSPRRRSARTASKRARLSSKTHRHLNPDLPQVVAASSDSPALPATAGLSSSTGEHLNVQTSNVATTNTAAVPVKLDNTAAATAGDPRPGQPFFFSAKGNEAGTRAEGVHQPGSSTSTSSQDVPIEVIRGSVRKLLAKA